MLAIHSIGPGYGVLEDVSSTLNTVQKIGRAVAKPFTSGDINKKIEDGVVKVQTLTGVGLGTVVLGAVVAGFVARGILRRVV